MGRDICALHIDILFCMGFCTAGKRSSKITTVEGAVEENIMKMTNAYQSHHSKLRS